MASVVLENVSKIFREPGQKEISAVSRINMEIADGQLLAILGPSGSGKTTLLRLIAGLEGLSAGKISIGGQILNDIAPEHRDVAMVFQHDALYPHMSVMENLGFGLKLRRVPRAEIDQRVRDTAALLGLTPLLGRAPKSLSGGERQRVALGRAIVRQPKVFLFDEPLSQLDAPLRLQLRREIARLHRQLAATMIYVTHDQTEAMSLGQKIAVLNAGVIQQIADARTLYDCPQNLFVAGFIGSPPMNFFSGAFASRAGELTFVSANESVVLAVDETRRDKLARHSGKEIVLGIRPEQIQFTSAGCAADANHHVAAVVEWREPAGADELLHLESGMNKFVARVRNDAAPFPGEKVIVRLDMASAHFFDPVTQGRLD